MERRLKMYKLLILRERDDDVRGVLKSSESLDEIIDEFKKRALSGINPDNLEIVKKIDVQCNFIVKTK